MSNQTNPSRDVTVASLLRQFQTTYGRFGKHPLGSSTDVCSHWLSGQPTKESNQTLYLALNKSAKKTLKTKNTKTVKFMNSGSEFGQCQTLDLSAWTWGESSRILFRRGLPNPGNKGLAFWGHD